MVLRVCLGFSVQGLLRAFRVCLGFSVEAFLFRVFCLRFV